MFECYGKKLLRIDLSTRSVTEEPLREPFIERWVGGMGFGTKLFTNEVPATGRSVGTRQQDLYQCRPSHGHPGPPVRPDLHRHQVTPHGRHHQYLRRWAPGR